MVTVDFRPTEERYKKLILHEPASIIIILIRLAVIAFVFYKLISINRFSAAFIVYAVLEVFLVSNLIYTLNSAKIIFKTQTVLSPDVVKTVTFSDDAFICESNGMNITARDEYQYSRISSAVFHNDWFYIHINDVRHQLPFSVKEITSGSEMELKALLSSKLGKKFRIKS